MTLMKSLLLGSAATLVVVAGAQAADLPTRKGAPAAEYVKVCHIDGMAGFVIPGSDTCLKITGYLTAQFEGGNLEQGFGYTTGSQLFYVPVNPSPSSGPGGFAGINAGNPPGHGTSGRSDIGYTTRAEFETITKTNTAYGVLTSDIDLQFNYGSGFDNTGAGNGFINHGYLNWAGITAGKANSFFSFFGGGEGWANVFSPDRQGYNQPLLFAYTATFGGGFSATISAEDPLLTGPTSAETLAGTDEFFFGNSAVLGMRAPDIVGSIDVKQGWGSAAPLRRRAQRAAAEPARRFLDRHLGMGDRRRPEVRSGLRSAPATTSSCRASFRGTRSGTPAFPTPCGVSRA